MSVAEPRTLTSIRLPDLLLWRIDNRAKKTYKTRTAEIVDLLMECMGPMTVEERQEYRLHLRGLDVPKPATNGEKPTGAVPSKCPACEQSEIPIIGGPIFMIDKDSRELRCNNPDCSFVGTY